MTPNESPPLNSSQLFTKVDNSPLILFRIAFGFLAVAESWGAIMTGWVNNAFVKPQMTFPFIGLEWLQPLPGYGMHVWYFVMGVFGLFMMLGYRYRLSAVMFALLWAGTYFMQKTNYNNHYFLMVLISGLMAVVPADRDLSLDAKSGRVPREQTCARWYILIFIAQVLIVYTYASIAKWYPDWWSGKVVGLFFSAKQNYFLIGPLLQKEWMHMFIAWGGILFDLLVAPALLWRRTRVTAFVVSVFFHLFNSAVFQIGIFPYMALAFTLFFFPGDVLRRRFYPKSRREPVHPEGSYPVNKVIAGLVAGYILIQVLVPLRHHLIPGSVYWTNEGHRMSWRMMLRIQTGYARFRVVDNKTGQEWQVQPRSVLTGKQSWKMAVNPDMLWQFVQYIKEEYTPISSGDISIYTESGVSLNRSSYAPLIDPGYDMAKARWNYFGRNEWLLDRETEL